MKRLLIIMLWLLAPAAVSAQALSIGNYDQAREPDESEVAMQGDQHAPARATPRAVRHGERTLLLIDDTAPVPARNAVRRRASAGS